MVQLQHELEQLVKLCCLIVGLKLAIGVYFEDAGGEVEEEILEWLGGVSVVEEGEQVAIGRVCGYLGASDAHIAPAVIEELFGALLLVGLGSLAFGVTHWCD